MLVAEDVHQIRSGYHGIYTAVYLITGEYLCLIDSGETETWEQRIIPYIRSIGREPKEVKRIIHTHGHDDHSHGDLQIKEQTGAEIWISELGAAFIEQPGSRAAWEEQLYNGYLTEVEREAIRLGTDYRGPPRQEEPIPVDYRYKSGEVLEAGPLKLEVVPATGHTPDSYCLHEREHKLLFSGDAVNGEGTAFDDLPVFQDLVVLPRTMKRLGDLEIQLLLTAHPYLPFNESVLEGEKARELMRCTLEINRRIGKRIAELLAGAAKRRRARTTNERTGEMSTAEISAMICAEFGPHHPQPRAHGTVRLHLVKLAKEGKAIGRVAEGGVWWSWKGQ
jgi:glyoxylase-like metal-dependent hydrolase (beta-lactamase superfamily II)